MSANRAIKRVRTLYAIFLGIICVCVLLFILNVVGSAEPHELNMPNGSASPYAMRITDLHSPATVYNDAHTVGGLDTTLKASAHITTFDIDFMAADKDRLDDARSGWCMGLQMLCVLLALAITVLVLMALISFYRNTKQGKVFPQKNIVKLRWVGILIIVMSVVMDVSSYLERSLAADLLAGSEWRPDVSVTVHHMRIILGLTIVFMAEIFGIGRKMQEEQELTI